MYGLGGKRKYVWAENAAWTRRTCAFLSLPSACIGPLLKSDSSACSPLTKHWYLLLMVFVPFSTGIALPSPWNAPETVGQIESYLEGPGGVSKGFKQNSYMSQCAFLESSHYCFGEWATRRQTPFPTHRCWTVIVVSEGIAWVWKMLKRWRNVQSLVG